ncbi:MAG: hypothetical protein QW789_04145 [Nitrososphaerota archaeon]
MVMSLEKFKDRQDLLKFLYCCGVLEEHVSNAYKSVASRVNDELVRVFLDYISNDSLKHSRILMGISKFFGVKDVELVECEKIVGAIAVRAIEDAKRTAADVSIVSLEELAQEFDKLINLEKYFGEEYLMIIHLNLIKALLEHEKIEFKFLREIIEYIIRDEERHENILRIIKSYISQK